MTKFIPKTLWLKKSLIDEEMRNDLNNFYFEEGSSSSVYAYGLNKRAENKLKKLLKNLK